MKKKLVNPEAKNFHGESRSEVVKIMAESKRKARELADQLLKEIEEEKNLKKMEAIEMKESKNHDTTLSMKGNPPVKNENQERSNVWKWFQPMPEPARIALAESIRKNLFGGIFEKGFEKIQRLGDVLGQNDCLPDPEKGLLRFRERCEELLSTSSLWARKDLEESDFKSKSALSFFSSEAIIRKGYGALFGFSNISGEFRQAEGELAKS